MAAGSYNAQGGGYVMLRKIRLYGKLAKFVGHRVLEADVATAAEAVRFLLANWPELERHMADQHYRVHTAGDDLTLDDLHNPMGQELRIVPVVAGAGAVGRILAGIAIIAFAIVTAGAGIAGLGLGFSASTAVSIGLVGASLVIGGIAQLLTPTPRVDKDEADPRKSFSFSGIQNTSRVGTAVPVVYGELLVGSVVVSAGIDIVQVAA
jgi:predicted phage tail protein